MGAANTTVYYQTLSTVSFTLLGVWFAVLQIGHGEWMVRQRHRSTLHIALHFFLPGAMGLASVLSGAQDGGALWRILFILGGAVGVAESLGFILAPHGPRSFAARALRAFDPLLYLLVVVGATLPNGAVIGLAALQVEGLVTGAIYLIGLCYVWLAFAEPEPDEAAEEPAAESGRDDRTDVDTGSSWGPRMRR